MLAALAAVGGGRGGVGEGGGELGGLGGCSTVNKQSGSPKSASSDPQCNKDRGDRHAAGTQAQCIDVSVCTRIFL